MGNTHGVADMAYELQTTTGDLLPACVVSTTPPAVPGSGLTLAAFATRAYVRAGTQLTYVDQPAVTVSITGGDGQYWLAVTDDTFSAFAGWTRRAGSHYMWRASATRPADLNNLLVINQLTVSGGNITAVSAPIGVAPPLSLQTADNVAITGGSVTGLTTAVATQMAAGAATSAGYDLVTGTGHVFIGGHMGFGVAPPTATLDITGTVPVRIGFQKNLGPAITIHPLDADTGGGPPLLLNNVAGTAVGSIQTNATATSYNTSSDVRLKSAVQALGNALTTIQALRPVSFTWRADDSEGHGFLANEVQRIVPEAVTGEANAVNEAGQIVPQQIDHSKLVPWLVGACKELAQQVQALTARVAQLEGA